MLQRWMWILWPGFLIAIPSTGLVFSLFDPADMRFFGSPLELSPLAAYSSGFLLFWAIGACCSALTCLLQQPSPELNRGSGRR